MDEETSDHDKGFLTAGADYAERLRRRESVWWKRALDVQRPYRWNLHRLDLGRTLDVGCGIGRNLRSLGADSVGVDHNAESIRIARAEGLVAYTPEAFWATEIGSSGAFDSLLVAHVMEHLSEEVANALVSEYLPTLKSFGKVVFITPQEVGFRSDPTHIRWCDDKILAQHATDLGLVVERSFSFPFPRVAGKVFTYNEFVVVTRA